MRALGVLALLADVERTDWAEVTHHSGPYLARLTAGGASLMLADEIAVVRADRKCWCDRDVREPVRGE